ncbi:hypothetical protein SRHO_G00189290 [Serrasalmus rhombeus]
MLVARSLSRAELSEVASQRRIERRSGVLDQSDPGGRVEVAALCSARSLRRSRALFKPSDRYELLTVTRSQHQQQRVYRHYSPVKPPPNGRYRLYGAARDPETFFSSTHTKTRIFQQRRIKWSSRRDYRTSGGRIRFKRLAEGANLAKLCPLEPRSCGRLAPLRPSTDYIHNPTRGANVIIDERVRSSGGERAGILRTASGSKS